MKKMIIMIVTTVFCLALFFGCSKSKTAQMANELRFSLENINNLSISYDDESISFLVSDSSELVVKEYMTDNKSSYHAKVSQRSGNIQISEGDKPLLKEGFSRYIEVYLPKSYNAGLTVTSTNGEVDFSKINLDLLTIRIDNTSGTVTVGNIISDDIYLSSTSGIIELGSIQANNIRLDTTSGVINCALLRGNVTYSSTSGDIEVKSAIGSGSYNASNSGKLNVNYTEVTDDLYFYNKNDNITLTLPRDLNFEFTATTKNGSISAPFIKNIIADGQIASETVGDNPQVTIEAETKNGDIEVRLKQ